MPLPPPPMRHGNLDPGQFPFTKDHKFAMPCSIAGRVCEPFPTRLKDDQYIIPVVPKGVDASKKESLCIIHMYKSGDDRTGCGSGAAYNALWKDKNKYNKLIGIKSDGEYPKDAPLPPWGCDCVKDKYICNDDFGKSM